MVFSMNVERLYQSYHRPLLSYLHSIMKCSHLAEDIAQDTYLRLGTKIPSGTSIRHPQAYLFRTAHNLAMDQLARQRTEWKHGMSEDIPLNQASTHPLPDCIAYSRQRWKIIICALKELPPACQQAFILHKFHNLTHAEIARKLGVSQSMIEKHLMRALTHCRSRLEESELAHSKG